MPYFTTAQEWLEQSKLLLQARPTTTRISTKYTLIPPSKIKSKSNTRPAKSATLATVAPSVTDAAAPPPIARATLILKTYDPVSGVTLKYSTDKAAEIGRLVSSMAQLGRIMAGLPELKEDTAMVDAQTEGTGAGNEEGSGVATPVPDSLRAGTQTTGGLASGQASKKKGRKGKK